jgi:hypothetical protein
MNDIVTKSPRARLVTERSRGVSPLWVPVSAFAATALACAAAGWTFHVADASALVSIGGSIASVGATMLGFLLASLAVLASINHTHLVTMMRRTGHYRDLLHTVFFGCAAFMGCTVAGFLLLFGWMPPEWARTVIVALHAAGLASLLDVGRKFWLVLGNLRDA